MIYIIFVEFFLIWVLEKVTPINRSLGLGQQEYSSRAAAITWGIILAVLIPLIILIAFAAITVYRKIGKRDQDSWEYEDIPKRNSLQRFSRPISANYQDEEEEDLPRSPLSSDSQKSDTGIGSLKKRRSYDKVYRTHEPLQGRPNGEFENKSWDPNVDIYEDMEEPLRSPNESVRDSSSPTSPTSSIQYAIPYSSKPDLIKLDHNDKRLTYTSEDYAVPLKKKPKERFSSQSSIITDV